MPLGAVVSAANVNDSVETRVVLASLVVRPPAADMPVAQPDARDLPRSRADGAYGNRPSKSRQPGVGRIRRAAERCHAFLSQFGRIARRLPLVTVFVHATSCSWTPTPDAR